MPKKAKFMMYFSVFAILFAGFSVYAGVSSGERTIYAVGCHRHDATCYVEITGEPVGPAACRATSVRWRRTEANGEAAFTHLTAAFIANKKVILQVSDACYPYQTSFPTLDYWQIR